MSSVGASWGARERLFVALSFVALLGILVTWMTWASFSATTTNEGNLVTAGTVRLASSATSVPIYEVTAGDPGTLLERCVEVTYEGSLPADVRLYLTPVAEADGLRVHLSQGRSTSPAPDCSGFTAVDEPLFEGSLGELAADHGSWDTGIEVPAPSGGAWDPGASVALRFELEQQPTAGPLATGPHRYVWEARSR